MPFQDLASGRPIPGESLSVSRAAPMVLTARSWSDYDRSDRIAAWNALAQWSSEPNPFYESWYLLPSLRALDPEGDVTLLVFEVDGQLAGLMPIARFTSYYGYPLPHWRNWVHDNCFCGMPLVARGMEMPFWQHMLGWCDTNAGFSLFAHLVQMPATGPVHEALKRVLVQRRRPAATVLTEERAMLASDRDQQSYLEASLSSKKRKELRRQQRRLAEHGALSVERSDGDEDIQRWIEQFLALERGGWKGEAGSALACDPARTHLFTQALEGAAQAGRLERLALSVDGRPIAMLATFLSPPGAFSYKTAFDEDFARYSPGVLLQRENLAMLDREGVAWVDSCANQDHRMIDHIWRERRTMARHSIGIGGRMRQGLFAMLARYETGRAAGGIG